MLLALVSGFIAGIAIGSFIQTTLGFFLAILSITLIFFAYRYFVAEENRAVLTLISIILFGILLGLGRMYVSDLYQESKLASFVDQRISVEGIIVGEPDVRENNTKLIIKLSQVKGLPCSELCSATGVREKILVTTSIYPEFSYGDKVKVNMKLEEPEEFETDGRVFDYKGYLRVRGIWYTGSFAKIELISSGHGSVIKSLLFKIKHKFTDSINNALPQPESSLLSGLLLGSKQSLGKDLLSEFQKTGTSHVVVLSGYNIAIVASSIMTFFKFLPKNFSFGAGAISIILFTILSGGSASAWRAAIMVLVALFAKKSNRDYKASRVLGFTIVLMLAPNPLLLSFDPSFQLSVLATIGLIFVSPLLSPYLTKVTERFQLREIISTTIATQITVLPYLIYNMGTLSLVSLPVNVLILSTIPLTMLLGFITGLVGIISLYLSFIPALFTYVLLWYQLTVVHIGAILPFGALTLPAFSPIILILVYIGIFIGLYRLKNL